MQVPEPFQLPGDALHQHAEAAKQQYLEEEEQKRKDQAAFKVCSCVLTDCHAAINTNSNQTSRGSVYASNMLQYAYMCMSC